MGEAIVFTSGKGGVGKTTTIANIGTALSQLDKKVVMLDTDMGLRNLDVIMGLEDRITYNLIDLLENRCRLTQALIRDKRFPNLYMIPAPLRSKRVVDREEKMGLLIRQLKEEFDYCLIDCPAGIDEGFQFAVSAADRAIVITTPHISAVRDAGRVIFLLEGNRFGKIDLLINEMNVRMIQKHDMLSREDVEEVLGLTSLGCISVDEKVIISQNKGIPVVALKSKAGKQFSEIAKMIASPEEKPEEEAPKAVLEEKKHYHFFRRKEYSYES